MLNGPVSAVSGEAVDRKAMLEEAARRLVAAEQARDVAALEALLGQDYIGHDPVGRPQDKATVLAAYSSGQVRLDHVTLRDLSTRVLGDAGLVAGTSELTGQANGERVDLRLRFLDVYIWRDGRWELVASQDTTVP
jgi:ketosteroid isomerase-like protein